MVINERNLTPEEISIIKAEISKINNNIKEDIFVYFSPWYSLIMVLTMTWLIGAWVISKISNYQFGWGSEHSRLILIAIIVFSSIWMAYEMTKNIHVKLKRRKNLQKDIDNNIAQVCNLKFKGMKKFQEQEHGGLIYFLLTEDEKVFVTFDYKSQELGVGGENPLDSNYLPKSELEIIKAPISGTELSTNYKGKEFNITTLLKMNNSIKRISKFESFCNVKWSEIEDIYAA